MKRRQALAVGLKALPRSDFYLLSSICYPRAARCSHLRRHRLLNGRHGATEGGGHGAEQLGLGDENLAIGADDMRAGHDEALLDRPAGRVELVEGGVELNEGARGRREEGEPAFEQLQLAGTRGKRLGGAEPAVGGGVGEGGKDDGDLASYGPQ